VVISDATMAFEPIVLTKRGCAADLMALEQAVTAALTGTATYEIDADSLTITAGGHGLRLVAPTR
jgi:heat shock protein HslJ